MDLGKCVILPLALTIPLIADPLPAQDKGKASDLFETPVRVEEVMGPIDVAIGHAAPFMADLDKDGKDDLLVGQFGKGRLRIYKNVGSQQEPEFRSFDWLMAEKEIASVPSG